MPKRTDINSILIIGSGPIVIGQACEFDYSGTQACKALKEEGFRVILVNSNPATIMTDPDMAHSIYIEPVTPEIVELIIQQEHPDAILPTLGGQTGLNVATVLAREGVLDRYGVEMIGANAAAIRKAENREEFKLAMEKIGLKVPTSGLAYNLDQARDVARQLGFPLIIRPGFSLGGTGGSIAHNIEEFDELAARGLKSSMVSEILIEKSVVGWKEYELEVMRDLNDNVVIICSIENFDPMGVHTGDSITVAPAQTLTDKEYQLMRDAAIACIREIGVETGGSNIQFAVHPRTGEMVIIEMNPRVSRSSALASKATGFPIAKIAAKLAVGYTLDEIPNDITKETPASFEPTLDYCVVKIPRFTFEKFPGSDPTLTIQMKSVGETMAIGRTFKESLQKGLRSLEIGRYGLGTDGSDLLREAKGPYTHEQMTLIRKKLRVPNQERIFYIRHALRAGMPAELINKLTAIDPWFIYNIKQLVEMEDALREKAARHGLDELDGDLLRESKSWGFSDRQLASIFSTTEDVVCRTRLRHDIHPVFKRVDTCAAEFEASTPYYYSTYEEEEEAQPLDDPKVLILGGGPNRIGQGVEFDYCCVHASFALKELGYNSIMVNSNPETVSTDYDTSTRLYFEPLTLEDVLNIVNREKPTGIIVQFGGQTPLNLAEALEKAGAPIIGTSPRNIAKAEDRHRFSQMLKSLGLNQPAHGVGGTLDEIRREAAHVGFPVLVRPSYVLGGRAMAIIYDMESLKDFARDALEASEQHPVLIDKFLEDAIEIDVDAVADGHGCVVAGIMEHIEEAGVHSGDSACVLPPQSLERKILDRIREHTRALAAELNVVGLINIQYAVQEGKIYVLEVNPRASRTIPFVSKATGVPWAKVAAKVMVGNRLDELGIREEVVPQHVAVKESVFPFNRFPGVDPILGPEMKSTGEVMGIDTNFGLAYAKAQLAAGQNLPLNGTVFISMSPKDRPYAAVIAWRLHTIGFKLVATLGTSQVLRRSGIPVERVRKVHEGQPNIRDMILNGQIDLVINTPVGKLSREDQSSIRPTAVQLGIPYVTTVAGAVATVNAIEALKRDPIKVRSIQEFHKHIGLSY
ncbi:MAG: carbamoyl-phosphate synthase large subunit [Deltaproteobacteria bacterium]|nr:carbamoyl-phosphate synthase large subunit [Deltaproteobacteria bacterium]